MLHWRGRHPPGAPQPGEGCVNIAYETTVRKPIAEYNENAISVDWSTTVSQPHAEPAATAAQDSAVPTPRRRAPASVWTA